MNKYTLTVGLEIHAELNTQTKMFCNSKNDPDETRPNVNVCPVCMGHPGTLPVINKEAVRSVLRFGTAVGGTLADYTEFDRKNYFYPDIPKGYQISQYKHPLVSGGEIAGVPLTRVHLEEDTARSVHGTDSNDQSPNTNNQIGGWRLDVGYSLLDFNRAGVPLMELVTEPAIHDAETAGRFAKEFQILLLYLGISHANMEKGEMRIEANISVAKTPTSNDQPPKLGTKVEVKNLNSFKAVERAINYEYERQVALLEEGQVVVQETRGWDEGRQETFSQRIKEESHDYRYFPDPDLPKLFLSEIPEFSSEELRKSLPELPEEKRVRLGKLGIKPEHVEIYVNDFDKSNFFESVLDKLGGIDMTDVISNYVITDLKGTVEVDSFAELMQMVSQGELSSRATKDILNIMQTTGGNPRTIAEEKDWMQISDRDQLEEIARSVLAENEDKDAPQAFLVGQAIKKSGGRANPRVLNEIFKSLLEVGN